MLLPSLDSRVAERADLPEVGGLARFDNEVYFHVTWLPNVVFSHKWIELNFVLFVTKDGSVALPTLAEVGDWLRTSWRYNFTPLGGFFGRPQARTDLRRLRDRLGGSSAAMVMVYIQKGARTAAEASLRMVRADFNIAPQNGINPEGHDWNALGERILGCLNEIRAALGRGGDEGRTTTQV